MPAAFDACVKNGGKLRTMKMGKDKYARICIIHGHTYMGEIKRKKEKKKGR